MASYSNTSTSASARFGAASTGPRRCLCSATATTAASSSRSAPNALTLFSCLCTALLALPELAHAWDGTWHKARGTRYGGQDDWWNINEGSCGYGYLDRDRATGWDIAAMSDQNWDFSGSCGRCFEVRCDPTTISDNYGQSFDRNSVCRDPSASVIVQITDSCPCYYPTNQYSNKRWCCGDMYHMDLSTWAFEKLADNKWGVIGILVRPVSCDYTPEKRASSPPEGDSPENTRIPRPWGWSDKRPWP